MTKCSFDHQIQGKITLFEEFVTYPNRLVIASLKTAQFKHPATGTLSRAPLSNRVKSLPHCNFSCNLQCVGRQVARNIAQVFTPGNGQFLCNEAKSCLKSFSASARCVTLCNVSSHWHFETRFTKNFTV